MSTQETAPHLVRPPAVVILMTLLWGFAATCEGILWYLHRTPYYLIVTIVASILTVGILKGYLWIYWLNVVVCSIALGIGIFQLEMWDVITGKMIYRTAGTFAIICLHQLKSYRMWFGIEQTKRKRLVFWLVVGALAALGVFVLPTLASLRR